MASALLATHGEPDPDWAENDLSQVRSAIDLIVSGMARRVTLVGLRSAERLLPQAQILCAEAGLTARVVRHANGSDCDITVQSRR